MAKFLVRNAWAHQGQWYMKRVFFFFLGCFLICTLTSISAAAEIVSDRVAAVVNGEVILESDVKKHKQPLMRSFLSLPLGVVPPGKWPTEREILEELIIIHLLEQEASKKGLKIEDRILDASLESIRKRNNLSEDQFVLHLSGMGMSYPEYRKLMRRQLTLNRLISAEVAQKVPLSEEDAQQFFKKHKGEIDDLHNKLIESMTPARPQPDAKQPEIPKTREIYVGGQVRLRQITLKLPKGGKKPDMERVMAQARDIYKEAMTGGDFAQLAKRYSKDHLASSGGDLGFMDTKNMVPALQKLIQRFKEGDLIPPLTSPDSVVIFYIADTRNRVKKVEPIPEKERKQLEEQFNKQRENAQKRNAPDTAEKPDEKEQEVKNNEKSLGILTPDEEKEYRKVRRKVMELIRTEKIQTRMKEWLEELRKNSIIEIKI
jgi:peptidyl-prolyl cis-trans isomerase SurA